VFYEWPFYLKMKEIKLTQGLIAFVDDDDFERLNSFKWFAHKSGNAYYAETIISVGYKKQDVLKMHRLVMNLGRCEMVVDHKDMNGLNNTKENLRVCTRSQNAMNKKSQTGSFSKYKGVSYHKRNKKFQAEITINSKKKHIGYYHKDVDAAIAYDNKAIEFFGEFAVLNFSR